MKTFLRAWVDSLPALHGVVAYGIASEFFWARNRETGPVLGSVFDGAGVLLTFAVVVTVASAGVWILLYVAAHGRKTVVPYARGLLNAGCLVVLVVVLLFSAGRFLRSYGGPHPEQRLLQGVVVAVGLAALACGGVAAARGELGAALRRLSGWSGWSGPVARLVYPLFAACLLMLGAAFVTHARVVAQPSQDKISDSRPNVVVVVFDGMRAASMSLYGYGLSTTPNLTEFGRRSHVFARMHSNATSTRPSISTLVTGKSPLTHRVLGDYPLTLHREQNLFSILRQRGYATGVVKSHYNASPTLLGLSSWVSLPEVAATRARTLSAFDALGVPRTNVGGEMWLDFWKMTATVSNRPTPKQSARLAFESAREAIGELPEPFLLLVHVYETHQPFRPSADVVRRFAATDKPTLNALYDASIATADTEFAAFLRYLEAAGLLNRSMVVVTADHGARVGPELASAGYLSELMTAVPLVIHLPRQTEGRVTEDLAQLADIAPTILAALGNPVPAWMEGHDLLARVAGQRDSAVVAVHPAESEPRNLESARVGFVAVWRGNQKLVYECTGRGAVVYDLERDPTERAGRAVTLGGHVSLAGALRMLGDSSTPGFLPRADRELCSLEGSQ